MHVVSEYEQKETHLNYLIKKKKIDLRNASRENTVQNENENINETNQPRKRNSYPVDTLEH